MAPGCIASTILPGDQERRPAAGISAEQIAMSASASAPRSAARWRRR